MDGQDGREVVKYEMGREEIIKREQYEHTAREHGANQFYNSMVSPGIVGDRSNNLLQLDHDNVNEALTLLGWQS